MAYSEEKTLRDHEEPVTYNFDDVKARPATYFKSGSYLSDSEEEQEREKEQEESRATKIVRVVVIAFISIVIILSSTRLIFHLLRPELPSVQLDSFNLSNFNVSETRISTDWKANITVTNPDSKFSFIFSETYGSIWYGGKILSEVVATDDRDHKFGRKEKGAISFKQANATLVEVSRLEEKGSDGKKLDEGVVSFIKKKADSDRRELRDIKDHSVKGGSLTMEFGLLVDTIALANSWWERKVILVFSCGNLTMRFVSDTEAAAVLGNHGRTCFITSYK